ncbi:MAG: hypothetical protein H6Q74_1510 [Firmicutes bacterium]|nr:hypothetical protein [Bacillota bacterium]
MAGVSDYGLSLDYTSDGGSIVRITLSNSSATTAIAGTFVATAFYDGTTTDYFLTDTIGGLAAGASTTMSLGIGSESYSVSNVYVGIGFTS